MKVILRVSKANKYFYVLADKFLLKSKITAIDNCTKEPLNPKDLTYAITEIKDGHLSTNCLGYISDILPGNHSLKVKLKKQPEVKEVKNAHYFNTEEICIWEVVYSFF